MGFLIFHPYHHPYQTVPNRTKPYQTVPNRPKASFQNLVAVIEVWIASSDVWGYGLHERGKLTAAFNSSPGHFGREEQPLPQNGDAPRLCRAIGLEKRIGEVRAAERRWSLFSDIPCAKFCKAIGALPGTLHPADLEQWNQGQLAIKSVDGWTIEPLLFERRRGSDEETPEPVLHQIAIRSFEPKEPRYRPGFDSPLGKLAEKSAEQMRRAFSLLTPVIWLLKPIGWCLAAPFVFQLWLHKSGLIGRKRQTSNAAGLLDIIQTPPELWHQDGPWLANRRHRCRIRPQGQTQTAGNPGFFLYPNQVFAFRLADVEIDCLAIRPDQLRKFFDLRPTQKCLKDESFLAGSFPARFLVVKDENPQQHSTAYSWFVEREGLIYEFSPRGQTILPEPALASVTEVVRTFETLPEFGTAFASAKGA